MISPVIVTIFTLCYLTVTIRLCKGLKLGARELALSGVVCALTLVL